MQGREFYESIYFDVYSSASPGPKYETYGGFLRTSGPIGTVYADACIHTTLAYACIYHMYTPAHVWTNACMR